MSKQASRYRQRFGGKHSSLSSKRPQPSSLHLDSSLAANEDENFHIKRFLEMQYNLENKLSSLDISNLSIGVNQNIQSPQDVVNYFSVGCQTDTVLSHDVANDTRKVMLDSCLQINISSLDTYSQTENTFMKNKTIQTDNLQVNSYSQTEKSRSTSTAVQTLQRTYNDISLQTIFSNSIQTQTDEIISDDKNSLTEISSENDIDNTQPTNSAHTSEKSREKSISPPLSSDKNASCSISRIQFPFALFNPLAARVPIVGIYLLF